MSFIVALLSAGLVGCGGNDTNPTTAEPESAGNTAATTSVAAESELREPLTDPAPAGPSELPSTASPLALVGALGVAAVAGALGLRRLRR